MQNSSPSFKAGTRSSNLAVIQTRQALERLRACVPQLHFEMVCRSSPGDLDPIRDLREAPPDFFARELDEAVLGGELDLAVHSAKDVPDPVRSGLDWFWLPWRADPRDVLVLRRGAEPRSLPADPVIGISSERRAAYVRKRFPGARMQPVRGNIEERLRQLDEGRYDALIMAAAALERLELLERATEWIPVEDLAPPDGQGRLAVTYRLGDARLNRLRSLFIKSARFASAGAGNVRHCTLAVREALAHAEVCLYDTLMDARLLAFLPQSARRTDVGKRCAKHKVSQEAITQTLLDEIRRGRRVVRLKGGDAGLFGRLAEELEALDRHELPCEILPGVSSLTAATTGTGMLLTRRGVSRGFCALTPRGAGGAWEPFDPAARAALPLVFFMALRTAGEVRRDLLAEGFSKDTPAAVVLDAGSDVERVIRTTLEGLRDAAADVSPAAAGLLIVGEVCRYGRRVNVGALQGARVLLTCSEELQPRAAMAVTDAGGVPVRMPMLCAALRHEAIATLREMHVFDWVVLTSPSAARCFLRAVAAANGDWRRVPRLMVCGPGTSGVLEKAGLAPDLAPETDFGTGGLLQAARETLAPGQRILRLRSRSAGPALARELKALGAEVADCLLYENEPVRYACCPDCEAVFFASSSAVESFVAQGFSESLKPAVVLAIGRPTARALERHGLRADLVADPSTVEGAMQCLARRLVARAFWP